MIVLTSPEDSPRPISEWRLQVLGGFRLSAGNTVVAIPLSEQRLVAILALRGPSPRLQVAGLLWPNVPERRALGSLRTTMWRLRRLQLDVAARPYPALALPCSVAVDACDPAGVVESWQNGSRYSSELLPGWYDDWVLLERERIRQVLLHATERAAEDSLTRGEPEIALALAMAAVAVDSLRESAHRLVVRAHLAEGNVGEARRHVADVRQLMIDALGVPPSAALCDLVRPQAGTGNPRREAKLDGGRKPAARGTVR
ncbi:MAG: AfsR/SARP family transcriptional regulator [Pseudonocardiaceae bacterium]